jgi:hydrogenase maturation protein HypF
MAVAVEGRRIHIEGTVQGVGFRPWVYRAARESGVTGRVRNDSTGVTIEAFGDGADLGRFINALAHPPDAAHIERVDLADIAPEAASRFEIVDSEATAGRRVSIPPDLATCDDCLAEIFDKSNRRHRYAFTNCTHCGPRFTIATDVPYDRAATTMAAFEMCPECRREYDDPADRRFHAQPNACPVCGPHLSLYAGGAVVHADDVVAVAARALVDGVIVALKGIGGFHLACDATSEEAVQLLRERKRRDEKPLAVMVRTVKDAAALGVVGAEERRLLTSVERPIVLLRKRAGRRIAANVAPRNETIGVMLAYSPLHHLLLADARRPLVMTSGNVSDEPIVTRNADAIQRLGGIADLIVLHDRDIHMRCDDSVVSVIAGRATTIRRSRGYVPRATALRRSIETPVLACGALLKNTFCLARGREAWFGPHIGDLENVEAYDSYVAAIAQMEQFLQLKPQAIAHDLHPDYLSTIYARKQTGLVRVAVQHHHAHVVSAMVEHGIDGPALGLAYDGSGLGADGAMWGGELLLATATSFQRVATFRRLPLPGGDRAIKEPWRLALALVGDACGWNLPSVVRRLLGEVCPTTFAAVHRLLSNGAATPLAHGVGRYFDAFGALFLRRTHASFEGQVAMEWDQIADPSVTRVYPFGVELKGNRDEVDLRPMTRAALADYENGEPVPSISAAFHNTLAAASASIVRRAVATHGALPIVGSGGCFQNARLAEGIRAALAPEHHILLHASVPPGDGGIALGQAVIAAEKLRCA